MKNIHFLLCLVALFVGHSALALTKVAIVGGGLAGTTALYRLQQSGLTDVEVTLFEASDRLGGRVASIPNKFGAGTVDGGPMFVDSVGQEAFTDLMTEIGLNPDTELMPAWSEEFLSYTYRYNLNHDLTSEELTDLFFTDAAYVSALQVLNKHALLFTAQTAQGNAFRNFYLNITAAEYLQMLPQLAGVTPKQIEWLLAHLYSRWRAWSNDDLKDMTSLEVFPYLAVNWTDKVLDLSGGHDEAYLIRGGTQRFSDTLVSKVDQGQVRFKHKVLNVGTPINGMHPLQIQKPDGQIETQIFDQVILATPAYTLGEILAGNQSIPQSLFTEVRNINYAHVAKIFLHYRNRPWIENSHSGIVYLADGVTFPLDSEALPADDNVMILYIAGQPAKAYHEKSQGEKDTYTAKLVADLERILPGGDYIGYQDIYWPAAYYVSANATAYPLKDHLRKPIGGIHFAGDYFAEHNSGYMTGAIESGERAAQTVLKSARPARTQVTCARHLE